MEIKVSLEELRKSRLFIGIPMYGGMCSGMTARSLADLSSYCTAQQLSMKTYMLFNESLVQRARNYIVDEFLRSDATHLMFIDSDIGFNPQDVVALMALAKDGTEYDVIGGAYPKKTISWEKIKLAVDKGFADKDPKVLDKFVGDYVFNPKARGGGQNMLAPVEVRELGTGFMMIRRETFDKYKKAYPESAYLPDHARTEHFDGSREINAYFDCTIEPETRRYLSEDYHFCRNVQLMGGKIWLCPWMKLQHQGSMIFGGSLLDLAAIGAPLTVDKKMLKK